MNRPNSLSRPGRQSRFSEKANCRLLLFVTFFLIFSAFSCLVEHQSCEASRLTVSVIFSSDIQAYTQAWSGFRNYFEEHNVQLVVSTYNLEDQQPTAICSAVKAKKPDLVFSLGTKASKLAKEEMGGIPTVFCMVFNSHELAGTNSTGVSMEVPLETRLQGVKRILPHARRIGVIYSAETAETYWEISRRGAQLDLIVIGRRIDSQQEFPAALKKLARSMDCFLMVPDSRLYSPASVKHLLLESLREGFPVVGLSSHYTKAGALFSFDCDYRDLGRQAAELASRVANGERSAAIPPSAPRKTRLSINEVAASRLGIVISSKIASEASEVFGK